MNLDIEKVEKEDRTILFLQGEVDAFTATELKEQLMPLVEEDNQRVSVDLSGVSYMDSTGVGIFIGALKKCQMSHTHFELLNPQARIDRLFAITGLAEVMQIRREEDATL